MITTSTHVDDDLLGEAVRTAHDAAAQVGIEVEDVHTAAEAGDAAALFDDVWGRDDAAGQVLTTEALTAMAHSGCQVSLARARNPDPDHAGRPPQSEVLAATAAWLGHDPTSGQITLHSHVTGVRAGREGRGIGRAMKWYQRAWALQRGITSVRWTFDPLIRRNAVLNLAVLGASAAEYHRDLYGPMADARNHALPTDRITAVWDLGAPRVRAAARGRAATPDIPALLAAGAQVALAVGDEDTPLRQTTDAPRRLVQVPGDIEAIRARDADLALAWTEAIRTTLGDALAGGARVTGVSRDGWYVLASSGGVEELARGGRGPVGP